MFESELKRIFQKVFDLNDTTFDDPGDSLEQEKLFIAIDKTPCSIREGVAKARVSGELSVFANADKMPFGYLAKCIRNADLEDVKDLFFYEGESTEKIDNNIVRRSFKFIYYFSEQYDPRVGTITSIEGIT